MSAYFTRLSSSAIIAALVVLTACQPTDNETQDTTADSHPAAEHAHDEAEHEHDHDHDHHEDLKHHDTTEAHMSGADAHHHEHDHQHGSSFTPLHCEPSADISVYYHSDSQPKMAHLLIDGIEYELSEDNSLPLESYISSLGLDDTHGLVWQKENSQATLYSVPQAKLQAKTLTDQAQLNQQNRLYQCEQDI